MRRVALLLCVLMVAPVTGAWSLPELPSVDEEWVVDREEGWSHADWVALRDEGLEPLRQISATEVLVWGEHGSYRLESESVLRGQHAQGYRVVLEPRLPSEAQHHILSMFDIEELQRGTALDRELNLTIHSASNIGVLASRLADAYRRVARRFVWKTCPPQ